MSLEVCRFRQDETACNYNADATDDDGSCTYAEDGYDCDGNCLNDTDGDGVCDEFEVAGCTMQSATTMHCNRQCGILRVVGCKHAMSLQPCTYAEDGYDCDGNCLNDADGDGVCDEFEAVGCRDANAHVTTNARRHGRRQLPNDLRLYALKTAGMRLRRQC